MYHLPKFNKLVFLLIILFIAIFIYFQDFSKPQINPPTMNVVKEINYVSQNSYEQAIIDAVAFVPTFRKAYFHPDTENASTYALSGIKFIFSLLK